MNGNHSPVPWMLATNDQTLIVTVELDADGNCGVVADVLTALGKAGETDFANAEFIVTAANAYAANQAEIERLRDFIESIKTRGYLANIPVDQGWGSSGKKPASKDVWCIPRHMLNDLDAALSGSKDNG